MGVMSHTLCVCDRASRSVSVVSVTDDTVTVLNCTVVDGKLWVGCDNGRHVITVTPLITTTTTRHTHIWIQLSGEYWNLDVRFLLGMSGVFASVCG